MTTPGSTVDTGSGVTTGPVPNPGATASVDCDSDGLPDSWEIANGLNPNSAVDGTADTDGDGVTNDLEFKLNSNPQAADSGRDIRRDTDGDGVSDARRAHGGHRPERSERDRADDAGRTCDAG